VASADIEFELDRRHVSASRLFAPFDGPAVLQQMHSIKQILVACSKAAARIGEGVDSEIAAFEKSGGRLAAGGRAFERFPTVQGLDDLVTSLLTNAKRGVREVCGLFPHFWQMERAHSRLDHAAKELDALLGASNLLVQYLNQRTKWTTRIGRGGEPCASRALRCNNCCVLLHSYPSL
jgi:hypothetical protein